MSHGDRGTPSETHIAELDGLRGIAVILVLLWHFTGSMVDRDAGLWAKALHSATIFGRTGVDLFFVLSGFLIIGILVDRRGAPNLFKVFYVRRFLRIHPPYAVLVLLYWACYAATGPNHAFNAVPSMATQVAAQLTFTWNWLMAIHDGPVAYGFSVTWSVAIEEWFYLIFPAAVVLTPPRRLAAVLAGTALASAAARAGVHIARPDAVLAPYVLTPLRLDGLCIGGLVALAWRNEALLARLRRQAKRIRTLAIWLVLPVPAVIAAIRSDLYPNMNLWGHSWLALVYATALMAILLSRDAQATAPLRHSFLRAAGRYSYSLYLFHPLFISLGFVLAGRTELITGWGDAALAAGALLTSILFCVALHRLVEAPALRFGRGFGYRVAEATTPAPQSTAAASQRA